MRLYANILTWISSASAIPNVHPKVRQMKRYCDLLLEHNAF